MEVGFLLAWGATFAAWMLAERRHVADRAAWDRERRELVSQLTGVNVTDTPRMEVRRPYGCDVDGYLIEQERRRAVAGRLIDPEEA